MVPSHCIVTKLSRNSLNIVRRTSLKLSQNSSVSNVNIHRRNFITILNPDSPKILKIGRNSIKDASETAAESEKIVLLRKALAEASVSSVEKLDATNHQDTTGDITATQVKQDIVEQSIETSVTPPEKAELTSYSTEDVKIAAEILDSNNNLATRDIAEEVNIFKEASSTNSKEPGTTNSVIETVELSSNTDGNVKEDRFVPQEFSSDKATENEKETSSIADDDTKDEKLMKNDKDIPNSTTNDDLSKETKEDKPEVSQKKKVLTKKGKKKISSKSTTDADQKDDSSSSSSSSSSDSSDSESESPKVETGRQRLDQVAPPPQLDLSKLKKVQPHVPKIKFNRKSTFKPNLSLHSKLTIAFNDNIITNENPSGVANSSAVLEWWERPERFARQDVDTNEIDQINSGGAEKIFQ